MEQGAAFFDLDRTLLRGASGPVLTRALRGAGLVGSRSYPGEAALNRMYDTFGENRVFMEFARQLARVASGWPLDRVQAAAQEAAHTLIEMVQPFAPSLLAEHRAAGRPVVLATTTPFELIKPFADMLGIDHVIATRYGVRDGAFDGTFDGGFVWGRGKAEAVRLWADERGIALAESFAYSDSFFDGPLLSAVGHPFAVNPDLRLAALAQLRRWPTLHLDAPSGVPKLLGVEPQHVLLQLFRPELIRYARISIEGVEHIPKTGPAIIVLNHRSYFDIVAAGCAIAKSGRPIRVLAKKEMFEAPVLGPLIAALGAIRVDRGTGSAQPLDRAASALECGELVGIFPQGTIPRGEAFFDPVLKGHKGAARLAAMTKVPVIPVGIWGSEQVWPRNAKVPAVWNVIRPPRVSVRVGLPVQLEYDTLAADTRRMMDAISDLLPHESREVRMPTGAELARTRPTG